MTPKDIRTKIQTTKRTHKVTRAMEAVSAVRMRTAQRTALADRPYARAAFSILTRLSGSAGFSRHPLTSVRVIRTVALVIFTSDRGLAGSLNSGVLKAAMGAISPYPKEAVVVYAYGKKGEEHFIRRGYRIIRAFANKNDAVEISVMEELSEELAREFARGTYDKVIVAYSNFKSTFEQTPTVRQLLPLVVADVKQLVEDIVPEKGRWSETQTAASSNAYTVEPDDNDVLDRLAPRLVAVSFYHMLLEAKASEHSSRMVAMKNASDKSEEIARDLTILFNKVRQAGITREISEIVGGREALAA